MGDRVSISFIKDGEESVAFFSHWDGLHLVDAAKKYVKDLMKELASSSDGVGYPLSRLEPQTIMVDFIRAYFSSPTRLQGRVWSNYYLGVDKSDGDNSDNGHHEITL